jgi:hypothetical protein
LIGLFLNYKFIFIFSGKGLGEMFSRSPGIDQWGEPVSLSVTVDLVSDKGEF